MAPRRQVPDLDPVWRALANPVRRQMLDLLRDGPRTTSEVADQFPALSRFAVMQHLGVLEDGGLVTPQRDGRQRYNYLNPVPIQQIADRWINRYQGTWADTLIALKEQLERDAPAPGTAHRKRA